MENGESKAVQDEIDLLTLLIEKWDKEHNTFGESDPIELLQYLMAEKLKAKDLAEILDVSKGLISDITSKYRKRHLTDLMNLRQQQIPISEMQCNEDIKSL